MKRRKWEQVPIALMLLSYEIPVVTSGNAVFIIIEISHGSSGSHGWSI
jgi:hypothetical protein